MTIIIFLIILSVLVIAHEFGHFWIAKKAGVGVKEFGIGFPPRARKLFSWMGTDFTLNWLPFGGFVKMEDEGERKISVLIAGVVANFILAWILFTIVLMLGIEGQDGFVQRGLFDGLWHGLLTTGKITWLTIGAIWHLLAGAFTGQGSLADVVGPVGLVGLVGEAKMLGLSYVLYFTALISVNLAIINLIPVPALDGGRILLVIIERVRGKRISPKLFNMINLASFALLILLMVIITVRDIHRLL
ncbi:site-2 protease family protein [Candidatus Parcubacteria bacterium]|nr:site-2 protease family protein [Candidatus Parcubacteria bacterium]